MKGAIFFSGQYGSTAQYAAWIAEATGLPVFDVHDAKGDPSKYDYLILGSSVIIYKLTIRKWIKRNLDGIMDKPIILYTVSGAASGPKLAGWVAGSLPERLLPQLEHVALRGKLDLHQVSWWVRLVLKVGAWRNSDPEAREQELTGFDFMDKSGIKPIQGWVEKLASK